MHQFSQDGWITTGLFEEFGPWHYWCYIYIYIVLLSKCPSLACCWTQDGCGFSCLGCVLSTPVHCMTCWKSETCEAFPGVQSNFGEGHVQPWWGPFCGCPECILAKTSEVRQSSLQNWLLDIAGRVTTWLTSQFSHHQSDFAPACVCVCCPIENGIQPPLHRWPSLIFRSFSHFFTSQPLESSVKPLLGRSPNWWSPPVMTFLRQAKVSMTSDFRASSGRRGCIQRIWRCFPTLHVVSLRSVQALLRMVAGDHFSWSRLIALELCDWPGKPEACLRLLEADELTLKPAAILCLENWMVNGDIFWNLGKLYENTRKYMVKACFSENGLINHNRWDGWISHDRIDPLTHQWKGHLSWENDHKPLLLGGLEHGFLMG